MAIRPATLAASIAPVVIGSSMAFGNGGFHALAAMSALAAALLIQIGTNLANDYFDFKKGADTSGRQGPKRVTQAGLIAPSIVIAASLCCFALALLVSMYLIHRAGPPILIITIISVMCGILYTAGPWALGYMGLGDLFVFIFFGPVAVAGTYFVQTLEIDWAVVISGFGPGFLSTAILAVNNARDIETDRKANKRTLAVRFGRGFVLSEYVFCILAACLIPFAVVLLTKDYRGIAAASLIGFLAIPCIKKIITQTDGASLNEVLVQTGRLLLIYGVLFSTGWVLCSRL